MRTFAAFALTLALFSALPAHAQLIPGFEPVTLSLSPQHPRPYATAKVTVASTLVNLSVSDITISVNGVVVGENVRSATVTFGGPGTKTLISATVVAPEGTYRKELVVYPADVALILEPVTTAPPLYEGARNVASEGSVRLIALPEFVTANGTRLSASDLSYEWRFGDKMLAEYSGIGKNVLTATAPVRYRDATVTVTVTSRDGSLVAEAQRVVSPQDPMVYVYRRDPLSGLEFTRALSSTYTMLGTEETLRAVPYFFSSAPTYSWTLNSAPSGSNQDLTLRTEGTDPGTASVRLRASSGGGVVPQSAETAFVVEFGERTGLFNLFGI